MHGLKNCSTYTSWSIIQPKKNEIMLIAGKCIELEIIHVKSSKPGSEGQRSQSFPSYVEARPVGTTSIQV
jgi:hypothetical protein